MNIEEGIKKMREAEEKMDAVSYYDEEYLHYEIDDIIIEFLPPEIKREYDRIRNKYSFWYA
jgi:hypothetical protein